VTFSFDGDVTLVHVTYEGSTAVTFVSFTSLKLFTAVQITVYCVVRPTVGGIFPSFSIGPTVCTTRPLSCGSLAIFIVRVALDVIVSGTLLSEYLFPFTVTSTFTEGF